MQRITGTEPKRKPGRAPVWLSTRDRVIELPILPIVLVMFCLVLLWVQTWRSDWIDRAQQFAADGITPMLNVAVKPIDLAVGMVDSVADLWHVHEENQQLKVENDRLRQWQQVAAQLEVENRALGGLLGYHAPAATTVAVARVVADQSSFFNRSVLAALGAKDGIRKNQSVIDDRGLVGRVQEVGQKSARILLITDSASRIPVVIERSGLQALAIGTNRDFLDLDFLDDKVTIEIGDRLLTSGNGGVFPPGLLLGVVTSLEKDGPQIKPIAVLERLVMVRVLTSGDVFDPRFDSPPVLTKQEAAPALEVPVSVNAVPDAPKSPPLPPRRPNPSTVAGGG